jgi:hypothetical protein
MELRQQAAARTPAHCSRDLQARNLYGDRQSHLGPLAVNLITVPTCAHGHGVAPLRPPSALLRVSGDVVGANGAEVEFDALAVDDDDYAGGVGAGGCEVVVQGGQEHVLAAF